MTATLRVLPLAFVLLAGCVTVPEGPSVMALPGTGKSFDQFRADDAECRQYGFIQAGGTNAAQASANSATTSAVVGTVIGTALGAAIDGSHGAGVGAATGLAFGALAGTGASQASAYSAQQRYDIGYVQCMYAKGHRVPVSGRYGSASRPRQAYSAPPPPPPSSSSGTPPAPPPGTPPPPPPDAR